MTTAIDRAVDAALGELTRQTGRLDSRLFMEARSAGISAGEHYAKIVPQHDCGAQVFMKEAIQLLRRYRDEVLQESIDYPLGQECKIVASNLRDSYEWQYPLLWTSDPEFIPFKDRRP